MLQSPLGRWPEAHISHVNRRDVEAASQERNFALEKVSMRMNAHLASAKPGLLQVLFLGFAVTNGGREAGNSSSFAN